MKGSHFHEGNGLDPAKGLNSRSDLDNCYHTTKKREGDYLTALSKPHDPSALLEMVAVNPDGRQLRGFHLIFWPRRLAKQYLEELKNPLPGSRAAKYLEMIEWQKKVHSTQYLEWRKADDKVKEKRRKEEAEKDLEIAKDLDLD